MSVERGALNIPGFVDALDVSSCQGLAIDYAKVAAAGFLLATVKASDGHSLDPQARAHLVGFRSAGLYTNAYGFAHPDQGDPAGQARKIQEGIGDVVLIRPVIDLEYVPKAMGATELEDFTEGFAEACEQLGPLEPMLYMGKYFYLEHLAACADSVKLARLPLWLPAYRSVTTAWAPSSAADWPKGFAPWGDGPTMWQYSGNGGYRVPGVPGDCDRSLFRGDVAAFFGG